MTILRGGRPDMRLGSSLTSRITGYHFDSQEWMLGSAVESVLPAPAGARAPRTAARGSAAAILRLFELVSSCASLGIILQLPHGAGGAGCGLGRRLRRLGLRASP